MRIFRGFAQQEGDSSYDSFIKSLALFVSIFCSTCGLLWSVIYYQVFGLVFTTFLPLCFVGIVIPAALISHYLKQYKILIYAQIFCIMFVTTLIQWSIGSIDQSGAVFAWSFLGPTGAMLFLDKRKAYLLMILWIILLLISTIIQPNLFGHSYDLPKLTKGLFYLMNLGASLSGNFLAFLFFYSEKERGLAFLIKNRELERTNYEQELLLRQNEKLATLGRLSAGIAHELNNPAAAVQRGANRLQKTLPSLNEAQYELGFTTFSEKELEMAKQFIETYAHISQDMEEIDSLDRSDLEFEMESMLEQFGVDNAWEVAPELVNMGIKKGDLESHFQNFGAEKMKVLVSALYNLHITNDLLDEIGQGTSRIAEIVKALKAYTYMDQSPMQFIQLNEGLNNTLVMLRSKLKHGIIVHKDFEKDLPQIEGYGSELNQVWTNLIDNAVDAMDGKGEIFLRTWSEKDKVIVEVKDLGKGISGDIKKHIFDPFFTTKEQGKGTGLGLHISYNIITKKHHGDISVKSKPGETTFRVELPIKLEELIENSEESLIEK
jgi:signal transduction histidine kinase